ncbi:chorismate mutase [Salinibacter altiplanensis]|uniref:chorismate mutase n=1 Tax=Salinibacter altiplanensis TaxID=1803181 RepID=UPI001F471743|nr:chorismate mutase [Salinibacter altiplanensis]
MNASPTPTTVDEARARIDAINERVVELLAERQSIVDELCALKADTGTAVRDPEREAELLADVRAAADEAGLPPDLAEALFEEILAHSVARQRRQRTDTAAVPSDDEEAERDAVKVASGGGAQAQR